MDENKAKELLFLENFLNNERDGKYGKLHYIDFIERGNYKIRRGTFSENLRETIMMPDNPEHSELDWWILLALNDLKAADFESIYTYLNIAKVLHPELLFGATSARTIKRRLNFLTKAGYIMQVCYAVNTDVETSVADELWKKYIREKEDEVIMQRAAENARDFSDIDVFEEELDEDEMEEFDADSINELDSSAFNIAEYGKQVQQGIQGSLVRSLGSLSADQTIKKFYGKSASVVRIFMLEMQTTWILETRYGASNVPVKHLGNPIHRFVYKDIALAAIAKTATRLSKEKSFKRYGSCMFRSKLNGAFTVPVEMKFEVEAKDGNYKYECALFHSYIYTVEGKEQAEFSKRRVIQTIYDIKNFIGQRGNIHGKPVKRDAFAIVVVNDAVDLMRFLEYFKEKASPAECKRIFFTGEGILESEFGTSRMIGILPDESQENGLTLYPAQIPVVQG